MILTLTAGSTNVIQLYPLENRGEAVTDATVQVLSITGNNGVAVSPGSFPISMPYSGALELYEGVLPDTLDLVIGRSYKVTLRAEDAGVIRQWVLRATVTGTGGESGTMSGPEWAQSAALAESWATKPEDSPVETDPDKFSALHHAAKASTSSAAAATARTAAEAARDKAEEWAESETAPGGSGTKSSKTHAGEAAASAAAASTSEGNASTSAANAATSATAAEAAETGAADSIAQAQSAENGAVVASAAAVAAKIDAEAARDATLLGSDLYATTAAGIAATVDGDYFSVPDVDDDTFLTLYRNDSGTATLVQRYPSAAAVEAIETSRTPVVDRIPYPRASAPHIEPGWLESFAALLPAYEALPLGWYETGETVGTLKVIVNYDAAVALFGLGTTAGLLSSGEAYTTSTGGTLAAPGDPVGLVIDGRERGRRGAEILSDTGDPFTTVPTQFEPNGPDITVALADGKVRAEVNDDTLANRHMRVNWAVVTGKLYEVMAHGTSNFGVRATAFLNLDPAGFGPVGSGAFSFNFRVRATSTGTGRLNIYPRNTGDTQATGDFVEFSSFSVREIPGNHLTQATAGLRPLLVAVDGKRFFRPDLVDDKWTVTLPAITGGTVIIAGLSGTWVEEGWSYAGGTLDIGPTSIAGLPAHGAGAAAGILNAVGDIVEDGIVIADRAMSESEIRRFIAFAKARGAKGRLVVGPEASTDVDLNDPAGWLFSDNVSMSDGKATWASAVQSDFIRRATEIPLNALCQCTIVIDSLSGLLRLSSRVGSAASSASISSAGTHVRNVVANGSTKQISVFAIGDTSAVVDSYSVRPFIPEEEL